MNVWRCIIFTINHHYFTRRVSKHVTSFHLFSQESAGRVVSLCIVHGYLEYIFIFKNKYFSKRQHSSRIRLFWDQSCHTRVFSCRCQPRLTRLTPATKHARVTTLVSKQTHARTVLSLWKIFISKDKHIFLISMNYL